MIVWIPARWPVLLQFAGPKTGDGSRAFSREAPGRVGATAQPVRKLEILIQRPETLALGQAAIGAWGMSRLAGRTRNATNHDAIAAAGLSGLLREPCRQITFFPARRPAAMTRDLRLDGASR
jgi:hypothetical protein